MDIIEINMLLITRLIRLGISLVQYPPVRPGPSLVKYLAESLVPY